MYKQNGFTLIELVITIILMSIVSVISMQMLSQGLTAYLTAQNVVTADQQARLALERMVRDLRSIGSSNAITTATSAQFTFTDLSGTSFNYALSGTNLMVNNQILANGITSLTLSYYDSSGNTTSTLSAIRYITISINVTQSNANFTVSTSIYPMNLN